MEKFFKSASRSVAGEQLAKLAQYRLLVRKGEIEVAWWFEIIGGKSGGQAVVIYTSPKAAECRALLKCLAEKGTIKKGLCVDAHGLLGKHCLLSVGHDGRTLVKRCESVEASKQPASPFAKSAR
jgi:hypothetical protein